VTTDDANIVDRLAGPESLLGMLQRGRGAGYLAALNAPRETVWPQLLECIANDPRLDQECEDRAEYYASLVLATGMDLGPIYSYLKQSDGQEDESSLPLETLAALAQRGHGEAVQMLRDYISFGCDWIHVVYSLDDLGQPAVLDGVDETVYGRIVGDRDEHARFRAEVEESWQWYCDYDAEDRSKCRSILPVCEPWKTLCKKNKKLAGLFDDIGIAYHQPPPPRVRPTRESLAALPLGEMLASVNKSNWGPFWRTLPEKVTAQDEDLLLENLSSDNVYRVRLAFRGLGKVGTVKAFEVVKTYIENSENGDPKVRRYAFEAIAEMPGSLTLETGRHWFRRKEWYLQVPGGDILENNATLEDVPLLIEALRTPETVRREDFRLASALTALARFEGIGPIPELEQIFREAPDCFDRESAAHAMAITAPTQFSCQYAFECLWDCHAYTQELGCESVSLSTPGALERLRELAEDPGTYGGARQAAQKRLETF
jgi:hypothetical protein